MDSSQSDEDVRGHLRDPLVMRQVDLAWTCIRWNVQRLAELEIRAEQPGHVAYAAFEQAHEHHSSIVSLVTDCRLGSAFALIRPCFEALVRGIWLLRVAKSEQFDLFVEGKDSRPVEKLLTAIKAGPSREEYRFLAETWERSERSLHQYTHVSFQLLARRMDGQVICGELTEEIADAVRFASATSMLASVEIARMGNSKHLENEAMKLLGYLYPGAPNP